MYTSRKHRTDDTCKTVGPVILGNTVKEDCLSSSISVRMSMEVYLILLAPSPGAGCSAMYSILAPLPLRDGDFLSELLIVSNSTNTCTSTAQSDLDSHVTTSRLHTPPEYCDLPSHMDL